MLQEVLTRSRGKARPHYALMPDQGPVMRDFWLKNYNLRVISYPLWQGSHVVAKEFLEKLAGMCTPTGTSDP
ncbi:hypothetical protein [Bradyrhizobium sp.]|uniref:hypothetical protein n=1 Tax=Bradyrhizobium sp. TaxID=376 RepID=UPI0039C8BD99